MEPLLGFLLKLGFIGAVISGTIAVGLLAMIVCLAFRSFGPDFKNQLPISCVIAVLMLMGFGEFLAGHLLFMPTLSFAVSGFLAFLLLRLLFKDEIEEEQAKDQEMTEEDNGAVPK